MKRVEVWDDQYIHRIFFSFLIFIRVFEEIITGLIMTRINIYIVSYDNDVIEEVERSLSELGRIITKSRSRVASQIYFYRMDVEDPSTIERFLKDLEDRELISWYKVEVTLGEQQKS
ncbi:MAG: hypothetical protein QW355_04400 [Sulfolobales archaeon]